MPPTEVSLQHPIYNIYDSVNTPLTVTPFTNPRSRLTSMTSSTGIVSEYADVSLRIHALSFSSEVSSQRSSGVLEIENYHKSTTFAETSGESL